MNYFICGFMAAGKSTLLNTLKNMEFFNAFILCDLDTEVFNFYREDEISLAEFINKKGLQKFREAEFDVLKKICSKNLQSSKIIALGGGALENDLTYEFVQGNGALVFLDISLDICLQRLENLKESSTRPMAQGGKEFLQNLYQKRLERYQKAEIRLKSYDQADLKKIFSQGGENGR